MIVFGDTHLSNISLHSTMRSYGIPPNLLMTASQVDRTGAPPRCMGSKNGCEVHVGQMVMQQKIENLLKGI